MRKSLKIMNYKFNQAQSTNRIVLQNLIRVGACSRPWGEGAESGEDVALLDLCSGGGGQGGGGDAYGLFVFIIFLFRIL